MTTCRDYIEQIRAETGLNYSQIADRLGITKQAVAAIRSERQYMDEDTAYKVAKLLNVDPLQVWFDVQIERKPASQMAVILRKKYAELFGRAALYLLIFGGFLSPALLSTAGQCILC